MKNRLKCALTGATVLAAVAMAVPAFATPAVYTDRTAFDSATTGQTTYGWPEYAGSSGGVNLSSDTVSKGGVTFLAATDVLTAFDDAYGVPYLGDDGAGALTISTSGSALGLYLGEFRGTQTVTYTFGSLTGSLVIPSSDDTTFFGLTSDAGPISVTFSNANEIDVPRFIAKRTSPTPEPMTLAIFGAGLLGAAAMRRRKKA